MLWPWPGFRVAKVIWLGGAGLIGLLSPILFSDLVVMIPTSMAFLLAGGPVFACAAQTPTCRACGLSRPHPGWHETPCRPLRGMQATALRVQASAAIDDDEQSGLRALPVEPEP